MVVYGERAVQWLLGGLADLAEYEQDLLVYLTQLALPDAGM